MINTKQNRLVKRRARWISNSSKKKTKSQIYNMKQNNSQVLKNILKQRRHNLKFSWILTYKNFRGLKKIERLRVPKDKIKRDNLKAKSKGYNTVFRTLLKKVSSKQKNYKESWKKLIKKVQRNQNRLRVFKVISNLQRMIKLKA